jgi:glycosyltransferase involved in cell wall biosynthesis
MGARIVLDLHDLVPELYAAKFNKSTRSMAEPLLKVIERWSCHFSDHVIISNHLWRETVVTRSVSEERCSVFFNNIDPGLFYLRPRTRHDDKKIIIFPGTLQWHQGVDIAIKAFPAVLEKVSNAEFHIYGGGGVVDELVELVSELGLKEKVLFLGMVPIADIPQLIANADLGVVPKRADSFGNEAYSTKIMEFMSLGVPAVISRTAIDSYYFNDSQVRFCESGNIVEFAQAMVDVLTDEELRNGLIDKSLEYVSHNHWGSRKLEYLALVDTLVGGVDLSLEPEGLSSEC